MYLIMVYYHRQAWRDGVSSELWDTAHSLRSAKAIARRASKQNPLEDFVVELEPGGFHNPLFRNGEQLQ